MGGRINFVQDWLPKEWPLRQTKKLLYCVVCKQTFTLRSLQEHISTMHLDTRCLQIGRCINKRCNEESRHNPDVFTINFLTSHLYNQNCEHTLLAPKKLCKHRLSNQRLFDDLLELSTFLGYVDESGKSYSGDPKHQERIDLFKSSATPVTNIDPNLKPARACFVNEYHSDEQRKQSRNGDGNTRHTLVEYHSNNQRSPAYDRSPGRSPSSPGRSPGGRSPFSSGRSPFNGRSPGRSPGNDSNDVRRSPAYEEPSRRSSRTFFQESTGTPSQQLTGGRTNSHATSSGGTSVAKKITTQFAATQLLNVKKEPKETEEMRPSTSTSTHTRRSRFDQGPQSSTPSSSPPPPKRINIDNFSNHQTTLLAYPDSYRQATDGYGSSFSSAHEETRGGPPLSSGVAPRHGVTPRNPSLYEVHPPYAAPPSIPHFPTMTAGNPSSTRGSVGDPYPYGHNRNGYRSPSNGDSSEVPPNMDSYHRRFNGGFPPPPNGNYNRPSHSNFPSYNNRNDTRCPPPSEKLFPRDDKYSKRK